MQWTYGQLHPKVLARVQEDFRRGRGLDLWKEEPANVLQERRNVVTRFLRKIEQPNPRPKTPPRVIVKPPKFEEGDCLAIALSRGQFGAALVLAADHTNPEYGKNLIGVLDYLEKDEPALEIFHERMWLRLTHHQHKGEKAVAWYGAEGFQAARGRLRVVGRVPVRRSDPKQSRESGNWSYLGQELTRQRKWNRRADPSAGKGRVLSVPDSRPGQQRRRLGLVVKPGLGIIDEFRFKTRDHFSGTNSDYHLVRATCCGACAVLDAHLLHLYTNPDDIGEPIRLKGKSVPPVLQCPLCGAREWDLAEVHELDVVPRSWRWACWKRREAPNRAQQM